MFPFKKCFFDYFQSYIFIFKLIKYFFKKINKYIYSMVSKNEANIGLIEEEVSDGN